MTIRSEVTLRPGGASDLNAVAALLSAAYAPYRDVPDLPDMTAGLAEELAARPVLLAETDGRAIGVAIYASTPPEGYLLNLAVHPDGAGAGLGGMLLAAFEAACRDAGCTRVGLTTHVAFEAALGFYARQGWAEAKRSGVRVSLQKPL